MGLIFVENDFRRKLDLALRLDFPYPERPSEAFKLGGEPRGIPASVLLLIGDVQSEPSLLVTRRTDQVELHKGQMAFPGGMIEPGESEIEAALRETEEEVGIPRNQIEVVGELPQLWTITGFRVTPVLALLRAPIAQVSIVMNPAEIAETLWVPLRTLQSAEVYKQEWIERDSIRFPIHSYYVGPHRIWGATGAMIQNLLARLTLSERSH